MQFVDKKRTSHDLLKFRLSQKNHIYCYINLYCLNFKALRIYKT